MIAGGTLKSRFEINDALVSLWMDSTTHERREIVDILVEFLASQSHYSMTKQTVSDYETIINDLRRNHAIEIRDLEYRLGKALEQGK